MTLTSNMRTVLAAILEEIRRLEVVPEKPPPGADRDRWYNLWRERKEYHDFGIRHDLALWLGHAPTPSESAVFSRTLRNMEAMGLVVRVSRWDGRRATHVQLTEIGRAEAERLVAGQDAAMAALLKDLAPFVESLGQAPPEGQNSTDKSDCAYCRIVPT
jgi:DNA-binding PadR family transcriptional regulator